MTYSEKNNPLAVIFGCGGHDLSKAEEKFFSSTNPLGFILFERNCRDPEQLRRLVKDLKSCVSHDDVPILIDQEGGRVARLKPPHWRAMPPASAIGKLALRDRLQAERAAWLKARIIAAELYDLGINVDCLPVLDVPVKGAHDIIGDRAFGNAPELVAELGRQTCRGLLDGGVMPVIKHIPGHGRAQSDSHESLPQVSASRAELEKTDFLPFKVLGSRSGWAMTAHVIYESIDPLHPATQSAIVIREVIRRFIGFDGFLLSDDLSMKALSGDFATRAGMALGAGCDCVLHCNGRMEEMQAVAAGARVLDGDGWKRFKAANSFRNKPQHIDINKYYDEMMKLLCS